MRKLVLLAAPIGVLCLLTASAQAAPPDKASPYDRLDVAELAETLQSMGMGELLDELVRRRAGQKDLATQKLLIEIRLARAKLAKDQERRNAMLDKVIVEMEKLLAALEKSDKWEDMVEYYELMLRRIRTEGDDKARPHVFRVFYFHARPGDEEAVGRLTRKSMTLLKELQREMEDTHEDWTDNTDTWIGGHYWRLGKLLDAVAYQGAWIRLNRAAVLKKASTERTVLLRQAIEDVRKHADAKDNSRGVKFKSLLLTGMAQRLLGEYSRARNSLARAADDSESALHQLRCRFETVVTWIDEGKHAGVSAAIKQFRVHGAKLVAAGALKEFTVDFQAALLVSKRLEVQAGALAAKDPAAASKLEDRAIEALQAFVAKHPEGDKLLQEMIAAKYRDKDPSGLKPPMLAAVARSEYYRAIEPGVSDKERARLFALAAGHFKKVIKDTKPDDPLRATAFWRLAWISNRQGRNGAAAQWFRRLAREFPKHAHARKSAENAVISLIGVLEQEGKQVHEMDMKFAEEYRESLVLLISLSARGEGAKDLSEYYYKLGLALNALGQYREAADQLERVSPNSEVYEPARFELLEAKVSKLVTGDEDEPEPTDKVAAERQKRLKEREAAAIIGELAAYRDRAMKYTSDDPRRVAQVRRWGAKCDVNIARLRRDVMNQRDEARRHGQEVVKRWPADKEIKDQMQHLMIRWLLEDGEVEAAIKPLREMIRKDTVGTEELVATAMDEISEKLEALRFATKAKDIEKLSVLRPAHREFAEKLHKQAVGMIGGDATKMYPFRQALASAYESMGKDKAAKALAIYDELIKQDPKDWINVRGRARSLRALGRADQAKKEYERLVDALPKKSKPWWRTQLELHRYYVELHGDDADALESVTGNIQGMQRSFGSHMGGLSEQFGTLKKKADERVKQLQAK